MLRSKTEFGLKWKLVLSFLAVIVITGLVSTAIGVHLIGKVIVKGGQSKVSLDLNSALQIYEQKLDNIRTVLTFTALRRFAVREAFITGDRQLLLGALVRASSEGKLDFLTLTDRNGIVVVRGHNPKSQGDDQSQDHFVRRVLASGQTLAGTQVLPGEALDRERPGLADRAQIRIRSASPAKAASDEVSTAGMVLKAAVPLVGERKELLGVLYGGVLLNRSPDLVDAIRDRVYRGVKSHGKDVGNATVFMGELPISTNARLKSGERAVGAVLSSQAFDEVVRKGRVWTTRVFLANEWHLSAYAPIRGPSGVPIGMLGVGMLEKEYSDMKASAFWIFIGVTAAGCVLALAVAVVLAASVLNSVGRLTRAVEALESGDFDFDISVRTGDEIGRLADAFWRMRSELRDTHSKLKGKIEAADEDLKNAYAELKEKQEQLIQSEKLASMGQLSAGVAHEINNPLGTILLFAHAMLKNLEPNHPLKPDLEMVAREATRCRDIVRGLLDFARQSRLTPVPTNLAELIREVATLMSVKTRGTDARLTWDVPEQLPEMWVDPIQIKQVLVNLVDNAVDSLDGNGQVHIGARLNENGGAVEISVSDDGCGIAEENLPRLFSPFFTTKEEGRGTGLGLAVAYGIVKMHRGNITVSSPEGKGTTFKLTIPIRAPDGVGRSA